MKTLKDKAFVLKCNCKDSTGETSFMLCNICGLTKEYHISPSLFGEKVVLLSDAEEEIENQRLQFQKQALENWVKCFTDDEYEPTIVVDYYDNGTMYFKFLNGS